MDENHKAAPDSDLSDHWLFQLDQRERVQVMHALNYKGEYEGAGVPGHSQFVLIAKLARMLNEKEAR